MIRKLLRNKLRAGALLVAVLAVLSGCKKEAGQPAPSPPAKAGGAPAKPSPKPVQPQMSSTLSLAPAPGNQFDFSNKKDPFKPYAAVKTAPVRPERVRSASSLPIHSFDVSQFRLIGIITGGKENQAMAVDPNGKGYVLKVGMTIGKNEGKITAISNSGVQVVEQFRDDNGRVRKEHIQLALPRKQ